MFAVIILFVAIMSQQEPTPRPNIKPPAITI
jgi:hypothetical protein